MRVQHKIRTKNNQIVKVPYLSFTVRISRTIDSDDIMGRNHFGTL